jgi:hypothetical protein
MMKERFRFYDKKQLSSKEEDYIIEEGMENHRSVRKSGEERNNGTTKFR